MKEKGCDRNCATCSVENRSYCAAQLGLRNQESLARVEESLKLVAGVLQKMLPSNEPLISPNPGGDEVVVPEVTDN